jgi:SAM-dependent methyltransferase
MSETLNAFDKALHDQIHDKMSKMDPKDLLTNPRLKVLDMLADFDISGHVADVGCGSGYFGIGVAKYFDSVNKVDCIEASRVAVESVIPENISYYDVSSKVVALEGSFDLLPNETYDVVFAMGALHHSKNLNRTMHSIFKALKPGGLLVAQEPAMPDVTSHDAYFEKYNIVEERYGLRIRNGDRYDRFFRECEYKYSLVNNGFDICLWENFEVSEKKIASLIQYIKDRGLRVTLTKILSKLTTRKSASRNSEEVSWVVKMKAATKNVEKKLFVARKSSSSEFYHHDD